MANENPYPKPTYLLKKAVDPSDPTRKLLIKLFTAHPSRTYSTQEDICLAIQKEFGVTRKQSCISKRLADLSDSPFRVKGVQYVISKYDNKYQLLNVTDYRNSLRHKLKEATVFTKEIAYYEHGLKNPQTFVFWISNDAEKQNIACKSFKSMLEDIYLDIFLYQDKLVVMLNPNAPDFTKYSGVLQNFFEPYYDIFKTDK